MREPIRVECGNSVTNRVMLKTAGEAGDVKTGWVRLSTSAPLRLITSLVAIISPAAGLCTKSIISPGRTDTEIYFIFSVRPD